jgi:hypothetical protein
MEGSLALRVKIFHSSSLILHDVCKKIDTLEVLGTESVFTLKDPTNQVTFGSLTKLSFESVSIP